MTAQKTSIPQGTLDLLVLKTLALRPAHGLGITQRIGQVTRGTFQVSLGSVFPALRRMEEAGWLASEWGRSDANRKAKYYRLTTTGRRQLKTETENWRRVSVAIERA